jgi:hypothetical protein
MLKLKNKVLDIDYAVTELIRWSYNNSKISGLDYAVVEILKMMHRVNKISELGCAIVQFLELCYSELMLGYELFILFALTLTLK